MSLSSRYNAEETENKWYAHWMEKNYFRSVPDEREAYTILIPPPNVTGVLHMGHMLNVTIQDVLIRKARLEGKNACWVPGTDHASIATEAKVVKMLREKGIKKSDLTRDEFLSHAFQWKDKYGGIILDQLKMLGASCDWERTRFTMEPALQKSVLQSFKDLYNKGLLYRGLRMTNWDPAAQTVLSNEEVIHQQENGKLYHISYKIDGEDQVVTIATTRPETILADSAIAVHPDDERYTHLHGKFAIVPMINRRIPIIVDRYVKLDFGTGALKVTPAHDMNDYEIGQRHNLEVIDILNDNGTLNDRAQFYIGMDRMVVRKQIAKDLQSLGQLEKVEDYSNSVGRSERTNAVVEPKLTQQWFLKMDSLAKTALKAVENGDIQFMPTHMINMYRNWLKEENVRDWCVSRQLWWGQQIPAYYHKKYDITLVATTSEDLEKQIADLNQQITSNEGLEVSHRNDASRKSSVLESLSIKDFEQDEDVVDTWFSSWLWPISVFDGFEDQKELSYYYPTSVLVTGWDIMFFWVARMIMAGYEWSPDLIPSVVAKKGAFPFKDVYFTGMVRDKLGRKMSKSLGNSPDSIELIKTYGADGVRFGILSAAAAGNDVIFDAPFTDKKNTSIKNESKLCETGRNFSNKLWNALRLIDAWPIQDEAANEDIANMNQYANLWMEQSFHKTLDQVNDLMGKYRLSEATRVLYNFIWGDFCSWYLEIIKPDYQQAIDTSTRRFAIELFKKLMTLLHPFMPFVTEEIWSILKDNESEPDCVLSSWPKTKPYDGELIESFQTIKQLVSSIRDLRNKNQLKPKEPLKLLVRKSKKTKRLLSTAGAMTLIQRIAFLSDIHMTDTEDDGHAFLVGTEQFFLVFEKSIDAAAEKMKIEEEIQRLEGFLKGIDKKLSNQRFVENAPTKVVEMEKKKKTDSLAKIQVLKENLSKLDA